MRRDSWGQKQANNSSNRQRLIDFGRGLGGDISTLGLVGKAKDGRSNGGGGHRGDRERAGQSRGRPMPWEKWSGRVDATGSSPLLGKVLGGGDGGLPRKGTRGLATNFSARLSGGGSMSPPNNARIMHGVGEACKKSPEGGGKDVGRGGVKGREKIKGSERVKGKSRVDDKSAEEVMRGLQNEVLALTEERVRLERRRVKLAAEAAKELEKR